MIFAMTESREITERVAGICRDPFFYGDLRRILTEKCIAVVRYGGGVFAFDRRGRLLYVPFCAGRGAILTVVINI